MARQPDTGRSDRRELTFVTRLTPDECHERLWPHYRPVSSSGCLRSLSFARGAVARALARGRERSPVVGSAGADRVKFLRSTLDVASFERH